MLRLFWPFCKDSAGSAKLALHGHNFALRAVSSLIKSQCVGDLYELFVFAKKNNIDYNLAYIPGDFIDTSTQAFDPVYMGKLYELGFQLAQAGYPWKKTPPRMAGH